MNSLEIVYPLPNGIRSFVVDKVLRWYLGAGLDSLKAQLYSAARQQNYIPSDTKR